MDCFFAAVVLRNFPEYKDKPVAISHHGKKASGGNDNGNSHLAVIDVPKDSTSECATCNYEARKHGVKKGMFLSRAKALCPDLVVLAYDFEGYEDVSRQVEEIVDKVAAEYYGVVEAVSCDEAYIEMFFVDKGPFLSLHDRAFDVAERIRSEIHNTTQCTASIGVANNKLLAKLGGEKVKPNGSYVVREYQDLLKELRLRDLHGVGWRTEPKLADEGLFTVEDVWRLGRRAEQELVRILGNATGKKIYDFCHGRDDRPVKAPERKTIGAECNYGVRFDGPYGIDHFMEGLAKEV
jgi:DNA repair protein REV1